MVLAVRLFVADAARLSEAHQSYAVDQMEHFREYRGRYEVSLKPSIDAKAIIKKAMAAHLRETAYGRCQVEDFSNEEKFALFVFHEDEVTPLDRFNDRGVVEPDWQRPVIRLAAVFQYETSTLLIKAPRRAEREKLRDVFAEVVIGDATYFAGAGAEDPAQPEREPAKFCFDPLRAATFDFPTQAGDEDKLEEVLIVQVVARSGHADVRRVMLEFKRGLPLSAARVVLAEHGINVDVDVIEGVRLQFRFEGTGRMKYRTVSLLNPNSSNLNDTERDRAIRRHLKEWGIDASERRSGVGAAAVEAAA